MICIAALLVLITSGTKAQFELEQSFPGLTFTRPLDLQHARDGTNRLFVVQQRGAISVFENSPSVSDAKIFLDIQSRVRSVGDEEGLLGLAFHPDYEGNGYFFVDYTASNPRRTVIARYRVSSSNPDSADENSELVLLEFSQPFCNHNGGQISFGPDGYLYIATGDGGSAGDPQNNGQSLSTLLGKILRIDVDNPEVGLNYGIPPDNPYVGNTSGFRAEIFAFGLRNPWRFSFDPATGWLWAGDVGEDAIEEVDIIEKGKNYGWNILEGTSCFNPPAGCDTTGLILPVWEYTHSLGRSITGGFVYRGGSIPELAGAYIYADFVSGRIWELRYDGENPTENTELMDTNLNIASFGVDENNELYLCAFDGNIYRFKPTTTTFVDSTELLPSTVHLAQNYPNPFNPATTIEFSLARRAHVKLSVTDLLGRHVDTLMDRRTDAGTYRVKFTAENLSTGVYLYSIKAGSYRVARKMVLAK